MLAKLFPGKARVLVVEDEADLRHSLAYSLEATGYVAAVAETGAEIGVFPAPLVEAQRRREAGGIAAGMDDEVGVARRPLRDPRARRLSFTIPATWAGTVTSTRSRAA